MESGYPRRGPLLWALLWVLLPSGSARAWSSTTHSALVRLALQDDPALKLSVPVETLDAFLAGVADESVGEFVRELRLNPATSFSFKMAGEVPGASVPALDVLAEYVNEPDWGMDQEICAAYPGTCSPELKFMGAFEKGLPSQAFRHMYWPAGYLKLLNKFLPIPVHKGKPIGEAPERAQIFFDLSARAARTGHPYWAARFLAWSMHYAQDATQPYHAAQLPSSRLEYKTHHFPIPNVAKTIKKLTYYHLAFEDYISSLLDGDAGLGDQGAAIKTSLEKAVSQAFDLDQTTARAVTQAAAAHSVSESFAKRSGEVSLRFFPPIPDIVHTDPEQYVSSDEFRAEMVKRSRPGPVLDEFVAIAGSCLAVGGAATRTLVDLHDRRAPLDVRRATAVSSKVRARLESIAADLVR
ncbi:MAG: hypothetical protein ACHQ2Z_14795 [Elusimicrobiota bacterium]